MLWLTHYKQNLAELVSHFVVTTKSGKTNTQEKTNILTLTSSKNLKKLVIHYVVTTDLCEWVRHYVVTKDWVSEVSEGVTTGLC